MGKGNLRNKTCPCGKKKKYKNCCLPSAEVPYEHIEFAKNLERSIAVNKPKICFFKSEYCTKISAAHSIPNSKILKRISENGDVVYIKQDIQAIFGIAHGKVGRSKATTFTGLCNYHDNALFLETDNFEYRNNPKENYEYALRALLFELYKKEHVLRVQKNISNELVSGLEPLPIFWVPFEEALRSGYKLLDFFKNAYANKKWNLINSYSFIIPSDNYIAVSNVLLLTTDINKNIINHKQSSEPELLYLTVVPENKKTVIIISWLTKDNSTYKPFINQLDALNKADKINVINNIIAAYCENYVFGPKKWESYVTDEQKLITELLLDPIQEAIKSELTKKALIKYINI